MADIQVLDKSSKLKVVRGQTDISYHDKVLEGKPVIQYVIGEKLFWFRGVPEDPRNPDESIAIEIFKEINEFKAFTDPSSPSWDNITDIIQGYIDAVTLSGNTALDVQGVSSTASQTTGSAAYVDMPNMTLTTNDLGEDGHYHVIFDADVENSNANRIISIIIEIDGVEDPDSERAIQVTAGGVPNHIAAQASIAAIGEGKIIKVKWKTDANTAQVNARTLHFTGHPVSNVVT